MATPEEEAQEKRKKRTIVLLTCGAVTLVLPLLALLYIRMNEAKAARPASSSVVFDRREDGEVKVDLNMAVTLAEPGATSLPVAGGPTVTTTPGGSSLDFIKGGANDRAAAESPPATASVMAEAPPAPAAEPAPAQAAAAPRGKKAFNSPKLRGTKSFTNFKKSGAAGGAPAGGDDPLKGIPGGVDNPDVQKYLKSQGQ